jgi:hypothetical protein
MLARSVAGNVYLTLALDRVLRGLDPTPQTERALAHAAVSQTEAPQLASAFGMEAWAHLTQAEWRSLRGEPTAEQLAAARAAAETVASINGVVGPLARTDLMQGRIAWRRGRSPVADFRRARARLESSAEKRVLMPVERRMLADTYLFEARWRRRNGRGDVADLVQRGLEAASPLAARPGEQLELEVIEVALGAVGAGAGREQAGRRLDALLAERPLLRWWYGPLDVAAPAGRSGA